MRPQAFSRRNALPEGCSPQTQCVLPTSPLRMSCRNTQSLYNLEKQWGSKVRSRSINLSLFPPLFLMLSSLCTILALIFTLWQVLQNRCQMPEIWGKSLIHAVWIIKNAIWQNICGDSKSCCVKWVLTENTLAMTYSQWESVGEEL